MDKVDAILCADWHLRDTQPICRTDDFWTTQWNKVTYIRELQEKFDCPIYHAGDLFHFWKPSPYLISHALQLLPDRFYTCYGNHDLPAHRLSERNRSGVHTLEMAGKIETFIPGSWGWKLEYIENCQEIKGRKIFVWHKFVWTGDEKPYPQAKEEDKAENLMELPELKQYDLIVTGDHHTPFSYRTKDGRLLVNAGIITRQVANAHPPCVWLYNADNNEAEQHFLPFEPESVSRKHLDDKKEKLEKLDAFIEGLSDEFDLGETFEENLKRYIENNDVSEEIKDMVWGAVKDE